MEQYPLLQTKLYVPPMRLDLVSRPALLERLNAALPHLVGRSDGSFTRKLTLISAPAGFGKTTLASEWVHSHRTGVAVEPLQIAWLSVDERDNDPNRFLAYLVAAMRTVVASIGGGVLGALHSPQQPPPEVVLAALINEVAALPGRIVLVLDDYHLIEAQPIHEAMAFLVEHLPPQMHLVIVTREDPHLPLARLRARGQLIELRAQHLRFSTSEAAEFLNRAMGLNLLAGDISALEARTEGWIAGLQLAALSLQGRGDASELIRSFTGSHRFVLDYLIEEVLEQQSETVQNFLLLTSVLNRLTAPLCDAVRLGHAEVPSDSRGGDVSGRAILEMLEHANLFIIPLDAERRWYRYHHLFSDLLRQRLRQTQPEQVPVLHRRASEWYEQNQFPDEAIEHALVAEDLDRAALLIEEHIDLTFRRGEHTKLRRWLNALPVDLVTSKPHLCILRAWDLFTSGQQDAAEQSLLAAEEAIDAGSEPGADTVGREGDGHPATDSLLIRGRAAAIRAFLASYRGDVESTGEHAHQALEYLPEQDLTWRGTALVALGDTYSFVGDLGEAFRVRSEALEAATASGNIYMILIASMKLAVTMRQQGRLQQVMDLCQRYLRLAEESAVSQTVVVGWLLAIWGEVLAEQNDLEGALELARRGTNLTGRGRDLAMIGWSNLCLIRILFSSGDLAGAQEVIRMLEALANEHHVPPWITNLMAAWQGRIWMEQDRLDAVQQLVLERGLYTSQDVPHLQEAEHIVQARLLMAQGRGDEATRLLQRLLDTAEGRGYISRAIEILNLQALALQAGGDRVQALNTLERALLLAEPRAFVRAFADEGPHMARLLQKAAAREVAPDYARRLLAEFPVGIPAHSAPPEALAPKPELVEPLSERELEVLQLVAEGLTNREIASRLFLSLNTVKAHTRNIYGKLGVHNRTQAVARAHSLGSLPST